MDSRMSSFHPLRFALEGMFQSRFSEVLRELANEGDVGLGIQRVAMREYNWATNEVRINTRQRRLYRTIWMFLRDIVRAGWRCRVRNGTLEVAPPSDDEFNSEKEPREVKLAIRELMHEARREKINEAADFIRRMENPTDGKVPVHYLIADGTELARQLESIRSETDPARRLERLSEVIQPYLQLVRIEERCPQTGHQLYDIWRYFRYTWSTPAEPIPGRALFYLIRDRARPYHPVIGIAALQNAPIRITARDNYIGWSFESFADSVRNSSTVAQIRKQFEWLLNVISTSLSDIDTRDLCSPDELAHPTESVLHRLEMVVEESIREREEALKEWARLRESGQGEVLADSPLLERSALGNISVAAETALYRRKRAEQLRRLLAAKMILEPLASEERSFDEYLAALNDEGVQVAIRSGLSALKSRHVGTSIMELTVCGAIPPYNEILGGKLIALLMLSPEVVRDYRERYGQRPSDIASRLKGVEVIRPADLTFLETTSLYKVGSSQYNRLRLPAGLFGPNSQEIQWERIGETTGYGTLHISRLTVQCMEELLSEDGYQSVNHVFGEGSSPKLRIIRQALQKMLGPGQSNTVALLSRHAMSRIVYAAWLATNGREYLRGVDSEPKFAYGDEVSPEEGTRRIIEFWRERWLLRRLEYRPALERMARFDYRSSLVGRLLSQENSSRFVPIEEEAQETMVPSSSAKDTRESLREFVRNLYRGTSLFADQMPEEFLDRIHVETRLDRAVLDALRNGKSVVLTGNPGDGKTHLQRRIKAEIAGFATEPVFVFDASSLSDSELFLLWKSAVEQGRPFFVAVNQAVLFDLAGKYPNFAPLQSAVEQVRKAVYYDAEPAIPGEENVVVFDLSRRNVLSEEVVNSVLDNLTDEEIFAPCSRCPVEGCDVLRNRRLLRDPLVRGRLQALLNRLAQTGYRATIRQLLSFVSYLLFSDRDCAALIETSGNQEFYLSELVFNGKGPLFDALRASFDPARVSHPIWDERLVTGQTKPEDWVSGWHAETGSIEPDQYRQFEVRKRAFYFFHKNGHEIFDLAEDDATAFAQLLMNESHREVLRTIIGGINLFFGGAESRDRLWVWQSHSYGRTGRQVLYAQGERKRSEFEVVYPKLRRNMAQGFDLVKDHFLIRLREHPEVSLRVDYPLYRLLAQVRNGVPPIYLDNEATRRIWIFMEKLSLMSNNAGTEGEATIIVFDSDSKQRLTITVDLDERTYLAVNRGDDF